MRTKIARLVVPAVALLSLAPVAAIADLADAAGIARAAASEELQAHHPPRYRVTELASLGGSVSRGNGLDDLRAVTGYSNLAGDQARHATLWLHGTSIDLGTLGGLNSSVVWPVKDDVGVVAGISETSRPDPLGEAWSCSAFLPTATGNTCLGFVWKGGIMKPLPTLGGNNGFAAGVNDHGRVVGWAENTVHDPTCVAPQVLQFRAVVWGPHENLIEELPLIHGDTSSAATAINDRGQVVGISGTCDEAVGRYTAAHAVLWENGRAIDIGNLGAKFWNTPMALNQQGDIAGFAALPGDDPDNPVLHAFLWTRQTGIQDLGVLPGDAYSEALGINQQRQVVGLSCTADNVCRAFLWERGVMTDLNTLVAPYAGSLTSAQDINDRGEITGRAVDPATNTQPAYLALPLSAPR